MTSRPAPNVLRIKAKSGATPCVALAAFAALVMGAGGASAQAPGGSGTAPPSAAATTAPAPAAPSDGGFLAKLNGVYAGRDRAVPDAQRAELVLLPRVAGMDRAPAWVTPLTAALATPRSKGWAELDAWAGGDRQRAALEALKTVTEPGKRFAFNQGYGRDAADPAIRESGLFTEVGEPAVLAAAKFGYLGGLDRLSALVHAEASRLGEAKRAKEATDLLVRWVAFGRMIADREFAAEKAWGIRAMIAGLERLRDVAYVHGAEMTDADLKAAVDGIDAKTLMLERIVPPQGDRMASEQLLAQGYAERGGPRPETFGPMMARISSSGRPLAQFGEAARWQETAATLGNTFETGDALKAVANDWSHRWSLPFFDPVQEQPTDYSKLDKAKFASIDAVLSRVAPLFALRQRLLTEAVGTRQSLGLAAFERRNDKFPPALAAIRPVYVKEIEPDTFDPKKGELHFFVPIRDQPRGERDLPKPHIITVGGAASASASAEPAAKPKATPEAMQSLLLRASSNPALRRLPKPDQQNMEPWFAGAKAALKESYGATIGDFIASPAWVQALSAKLSGQPPMNPAEGVRAAADTLIAELTKLNKFDAAFGELTAAVEAITPKTATASSLAGLPTFTAELDDTVFVLYSVGSNQQREWARNVGQDGTDILLWPPVLSLARESMAKQGTEAQSLGAMWLEYEPANALPAPPAASDSKPGDPSRPGSSPGGEPRGPRRPNLPGG